MLRPFCLSSLRGRYSNILRSPYRTFDDVVAAVPFTHIAYKLLFIKKIWSLQAETLQKSSREDFFNEPEYVTPGYFI